MLQRLLHLVCLSWLTLFVAGCGGKSVDATQLLVRVHGDSLDTDRLDLRIEWLAEGETRSNERKKVKELRGEQATLPLSFAVRPWHGELDKRARITITLTGEGDSTPRAQATAISAFREHELVTVDMMLSASLLDAGADSDGTTMDASMRPEAGAADGGFVADGDTIADGGTVADGGAVPDSAVLDAQSPDADLDDGIQLKLPAVIATGQCTRVTLRLSEPGQTDIPAQLSASGQGEFFSAHDCEPPSKLEDVVLAANASPTEVFFKPALAAGEYVADVVLKAQSAGLLGSTTAQVRRATVEVSMEGSFGAALLDDGSVWVWGHAQGTGQPNDYQPLFIAGVPTRIPGISGSNVRSLVTGSQGGCVLVGEAVRCFGEADFVGSVVNMDSGISNLSMLDGHACAVKASEAYCWGEHYGATPTKIAALGNNVVAVAAGSIHDCALLSNNSVRCWGDNERGQLGDGTQDSSAIPVTVKNLGSGTITAIDVGLYSSCALIDSAMRCWGMLGGSTPTTVATGVLSMSMARLHYCARDSGGARCWGYNERGQLGNGTYSDAGPPGTSISELGTVSQIDANYSSTCAIHDGLVYCWGDNVVGQLGSSTDLSLLEAPRLVPGMAGKAASEISFGSNPTWGPEATCAVGDGQTYCWGSNLYGALGLPSDDYSASTVAPIKMQLDLGGTPIDLGVSTQLAAYDGATCAIRAGQVICWGIVPGTNEREPTAIPLPAGSQPLDVCLGQDHGCVLLSGTTSGAFCWGKDEQGQLGDAAPHATSVSTLQRVATSASPTALACGELGGCAVVSGGVECWGEVVDRGKQETPVAVAGLEPAVLTHTQVKSLALGTRVGCALTELGSVYCWGGEDLPAPIDLGGKVIDRIAGGGWSTFCARDPDGLSCWGPNNFRQAVPSDDSGEPVAPRRISGLVPPISDFATGIMSCAVDTVGMKCWGSNAGRTYGGDAHFSEPSPVLIQAFVE